MDRYWISKGGEGVRDRERERERERGGGESEGIMKLEK
jgi:hypothetical protein